MLKDIRVISFIFLAIALLVMIPNEQAKAREAKPGCGLFYVHDPFRGSAHEYCSKEFNHLGGRDNEYSTMTVGPNTECKMGEHGRFGGDILIVRASSNNKGSYKMPQRPDYVEVEIPPGKLLTLPLVGDNWNDKISSIYCRKME